MSYNLEKNSVFQQLTEEQSNTSNFEYQKLDDSLFGNAPDYFILFSELISFLQAVYFLYKLKQNQTSYKKSQKLLSNKKPDELLDIFKEILMDKKIEEELITRIFSDEHLREKLLELIKKIGSD